MAFALCPEWIYYDGCKENVLRLHLRAQPVVEVLKIFPDGMGEYEILFMLRMAILWLYYYRCKENVKRTFYTQNKNIIKFVYFPSKTNLAILHQLQLIIITHTSLRYRKLPLVYFLPA